MKKLIIKEYWEKVSNEFIDGSKTLRKVLKGQYEYKNCSVYNVAGYETIKTMQKELKSRFPHRFICLLHNGIRFDLGHDYGIHVYQDVILE